MAACYYNSIGSSMYKKVCKTFKKLAIVAIPFISCKIPISVQTSNNARVPIITQQLLNAYFSQIINKKSWREEHSATFLCSKSVTVL